MRELITMEICAYHSGNPFSSVRRSLEVFWLAVDYTRCSGYCTNMEHNSRLDASPRITKNVDTRNVVALEGGP